MLTRYASEETLANYGVAFKYYSLLLTSLASITIVLRPLLARANMLDPARQIAFTTKWLRYSLWTGIPILLFDIFGKPVYVWLNGAKYADSFPMLIILSVGVWLGLILSPQVKILIAGLRFRSMFLLGTLAFVVGFIGNRLMVPTMGGIGASIATVISQTVINGGAMLVILNSRKRSL
jgi:O-antigen/teichoic acid export membrane protein